MPDLAFKSPDELTQILRQLSARLHYINRVSGESHYVWHLANLINAAGDLAKLIPDDATQAAFGNGYTPGTLDRPARLDRLFELLRDRLHP